MDFGLDKSKFQNQLKMQQIKFNNKNISEAG
jgi:hypothetical protein